VLAGAVPAQAQSFSRAVEFGLQMSTLRLDGAARGTNTGLGGRVTIDLARWIAVESEINVVPKDEWRFAVGSLVGVEGGELLYSRRRLEAFAGVKAGYRGERVGVFGKVRPGITRLTHTGVNCVAEVCALMLIALPVYEREFALDAGGVVEFYPSSRLVARFDLGDEIIRQRSGPPHHPGTRHNFTSRLGVGFRF
jgi:hypothetical protein